MRVLRLLVASALGPLLASCAPRTDAPQGAPAPLIEGPVPPAPVASAEAGVTPPADEVPPREVTIGIVPCGSTDACARDLDGFLDIAARHPEVDVLLAPEYFLNSPDRKPLDKEQFENLRRKLEEWTAGSNRLVVPGTVTWTDGVSYRNTTLAVSNGRTLLQSSKRSDVGDESAEELGLKWGYEDAPPAFRWRGHDVGVEICFDHEQGVLKSGGVKDLDLQIIVAVGISVNPESTVVHEGGVIAKCDSMYMALPTDENGVWTQSGGTNVPQSPLASEALPGPFADVPLLTYRVTLGE